ncbi:MAG: cytochrome P450 [Chloroflexota bacterium]
MTHNQPPPQMPSAKRLPLIGSGPFMLRDPLAFFQQAQQEKGDIYELDLGLTKIIVLNHPRHAQHILVDKLHNYEKGGALWDRFRDMLGNGLTVSQGDFWKRQRRMMQPYFHQRQIGLLAERMVDVIDTEMDKWAVDQAEFDVQQAMTRITMRITVSTLFGMGLSEAEIERASSTFTYVIESLIPGMVTSALPAWLPLPSRRRYHAELANIRDLISTLIERGRSGDGDPNSMLAMLIEATDAITGDQMTDEQLVDEVINFFAAGYETTAVALTWACQYLTQQPDILTTMRAEVDAAVGERLPTMQDLRQLPYTRRVLQETLRIRPPSYNTPRMAVEDDEIDGYGIPSGTMILLITYIMHRHPEQWPKPETFDPNRFLVEREIDANGQPRHKLAWMPFGAGQRMCIGKEFALMEGTLVLARLAQRFDMGAIAGKVAKPRPSATLQPKDGVFVKLSNRLKTNK